MAHAIMGEHMLADKTKSSFIPGHALVDSLPPRWQDLPGLVDDELIDADTQITILDLVEETGSASLGDLVAALPHHPSPARAVLTFVRHDILAIDSGLVTSHSMLRRRCPTELAHTTAVETCGGNDAPPPANKSVNRLGPGKPQPELFVAHWTDRAAFRHEASLQRPGIYLALYADCAYAGTSGQLAERLAASNHLLAHGLPDLVVAMVDGNQLMSAAQFRVAERQLARAIEKDGRLKLANRALPAGDRVSLADFGQSERFVKDALKSLGQAGIAFMPAIPNAEVDFPEPDGSIVTEEAEDLGEPGEGALLSLHSCGVHATARLGNGKVHVLAGSEIRRDMAPSIKSGVVLMRQELVHDGGLVPHGRHLILTRDVAFDTASGAASFVVGSRLKPEIWRELRPASASAPLH